VLLALTDNISYKNETNTDDRKEVIKNEAINNIEDSNSDRMEMKKGDGGNMYDKNGTGDDRVTG
jgi:hypothetical protein